MTDNVTCFVISTFMSSERSQFYFHSLILPLSLYVHSRNQLTDFLGANESLESILRDIFCCRTLLFSSSTLHFLWQGYYTRKRKRGRQREREKERVCACVSQTGRDRDCQGAHHRTLLWHPLFGIWCSMRPPHYIVQCISVKTTFCPFLFSVWSVKISKIFHLPIYSLCKELEPIRLDGR